MFTPLAHTINDNLFLLSPNRTMFWRNEQILVLSDTHFGKTAHFRKAGIAIPTNILETDLQKLSHDINYFNPKQIIIVGDLFHSVANAENIIFAAWRNKFENIPFVLVQGNHDVLAKIWYTNANIAVVKDVLVIKNFSFVHDVKEPLKDTYTFCGHIHPGITLKGKGKQSITLPCFYFKNNYAILPAFGYFTGLMVQKIKKNECAFAIANGEVVAV